LSTIFDVSKHNVSEVNQFPTSGLQWKIFLSRLGASEGTSLNINAVPETLLLERT
jgi:hypothetical protein